MFILNFSVRCTLSLRNLTKIPTLGLEGKTIYKGTLFRAHSVVDKNHPVNESLTHPSIHPFIHSLKSTNETINEDMIQYQSSLKPIRAITKNPILQSQSKKHVLSYFSNYIV